MRRISRAYIFLFILVVVSAGFAARQTAAQTADGAAKALTVERIYSAPSLSGHLTQGIEWAPDSKRISYLARSGGGEDAAAELWTMDAASGERKVLVGAETMKAVMQPE